MNTRKTKMNDNERKEFDFEKSKYNPDFLVKKLNKEYNQENSREQRRKFKNKDKRKSYKDW